jgi:DNA-binding CsgD family transcriptional regulator/hemerythrin
MTIQKTGHAEIDQQHAILENMVGQLSTHCSEVRQDDEAACRQCSFLKREQCTSYFSSITRDISAFLIGHATYEERMMELLPDTPICVEHIKAHKAAHERITKQLKKLSAQIASEKPRVTNNLIWEMISEWLGDHNSSFDYNLVSLGKSGTSEINFDGELVTMLDQHVFPNRPTLEKSLLGSSLGFKRKKLLVRGQFESLSAMQREVFWLVISGKKNREIAEILQVTVNTIKTHRAVIFDKMEVGSVIELLKKIDTLR